MVEKKWVGGLFKTHVTRKMTFFDTPLCHFTLHAIFVQPCSSMSFTKTKTME